MEITITRTGGFAGLRRQWVVTVDDQTATRLVGEMGDGRTSDGRMNDGGVTARSSAPEVRDGFSYVFAAEGHRITIAESRLDGPWRELLDRARSDTGTTPPA
ncbi:protealysin inhibitor emfourin [Tersicoccus sp. MR15.9]|uniref:protealysin inhibitor emfourin n=1 Tax=Tersicoccus mangrovi TaxID=3121635 RepID=UPI002FE53E2C